MTWTGMNFDIVSGASALALAALVALGVAGQRWVWAWAALGGLLLANILVIAVASTPAFHAFGTDPSQLNTFAAYFPFIWLPTVLVMSAVAGHLIIVRAMLRPTARPNWASP
jgi:hypothetical protein